MIVVVGVEIIVFVHRGDDCGIKFRNTLVIVVGWMMMMMISTKKLKRELWRWSNVDGGVMLMVE